MTDAGQYRRRIQIQALAETTNSSGGASVPVYQTVSGCTSVPAKFSYPPPAKKGDEVYTQQQKRSSVFVSISIRYRPSQNIDASMRVVYGTRTFDIRTVFVPDEYGQDIVMQCEEIQAKGTLHI